MELKFENDYLLIRGIADEEMQTKKCRRRNADEEMRDEEMRDQEMCDEEIPEKSAGK